MKGSERRKTMANDISLKKYKTFTSEVLYTGIQYLQEKAMAMKLADTNNNAKTAVAENDKAAQNQRN